MHGRRPVDEDRLPWLEPYKETKLAAPQPARKGSRKPLLAGAAIALGVAVVDTRDPVREVKNTGNRSVPLRGMQP